MIYMCTEWAPIKIGPVLLVGIGPVGRQCTEGGEMVSEQEMCLNCIKEMS